VTLSPRWVLDLTIVLLGLLLSSVAISAVDAWESRATARGDVSLVSWSHEDARDHTLEHDYIVVRNSMRRWLFVHFPLISMLGGALVGLGCSGGRRVLIMAMVATALVPITGIGLLIDTPGPAAASAVLYAGLAAGTAVVARRVANVIGQRAT